MPALSIQDLECYTVRAYLRDLLDAEQMHPGNRKRSESGSGKTAGSGLNRMETEQKSEVGVMDFDIFDDPGLTASMAPFVEMFPEQGMHETRSFHNLANPSFPKGNYGLIELYCTDPDCDCRRVMINVIAEEQGRHIATISYGFHWNDPNKGPFLDPLNPQSEYASLFLNMFRQLVIQDKTYVKRLKQHYKQFKTGLKDPHHPMYRPSQNQTYRRSETNIGSNQPCPCGSGKKYKRCCLNKP